MDQNISQPPTSVPHRGISPAVFILSIILADILSSAGTYFLVSQNQPSESTSQNESQLAPPIPTSTPTKTPATPVNDWEEATFPKNQGTSFSGFTILYPPTWISELDQNSAITTLTLTSVRKQGYTIKISQVAMGGAMCIYKGDPNQEGPVSDLRDKEFTDVITFMGTFRRTEESGPSGKTTSQFCGYNETNDNYGIPTSIGTITYELPTQYDPLMLVEMDEILKTLKKV